VIGPESLTTFPEPLKGCGKACLGVKTLTTLKDPVAFTERIRRHTGLEIPDAARAAEGYDIAQIIYEVSGGLTRVPTETAELIKSIEQIEIDGPRGKIRFENNHEPIVDVRVQEWEISGKALRPKTVAELGTCLSLDFGCGRVGFPKKPLAEQEEEPEGEKDQQ
jgi:ABC-type branched-subunit amino acid transport system substrate-binding protein